MTCQVPEKTFTIETKPLFALEQKAILTHTRRDLSLIRYTQLKMRLSVKMRIKLYNSHLKEVAVNRKASVLIHLQRGNECRHYSSDTERKRSRERLRKLKRKEDLLR